MIFARNLDLAVLALALPAFLVAGWPIEGYVTAAVIWAMWRGIGAYTDHKAAQADEPRKVVGIITGSMIGRGWLMAIGIFGVGISTSDEIGLSAGLLCVALFTVSFTTRMILRPFEAGAGGPSNSPTPTS